MLSDRKLVPCDCGFGEGFYHYEKDGTHEFNPAADASQAVANYQDIEPVAIFFGHIDERRAVLHMECKGIYESFRYSLYGNKSNAFRAIVERIREEWSQPELF